ncbi:hypothetical protein BOTNAR_0563g00010 [Botryotinia narcissicola]|uniref:Uncharacterized protein n=1 Tax=Botryotinia narcissicola TaxID=278944 RepID=A0A4Z1HDH9_9HELO|nr:hypothetical protein BOTNAR_0563g00010 [Botryotinia narcissicola]
MPSDKRPSCSRKMPERLNSPSVQIETSTHSQNFADTSSIPPPTTPNYASSSSPSSAPSTPTPLVRTGGREWRKTVRATLPSRAEVENLSAELSQESRASLAAAQASFAPVPKPTDEMPPPKPEDEYDVDSPYFGLNHTPEWDDLRIDIDDNSQGRWFPPELMAPPSYDSLSSAAKFMLFQEVTKKMPFKDLVAYLNITGAQLDDFRELYNLETSRTILEEDLKGVIVARLDDIHRNERRLVTAEDFDLIWREEVESKLPPTVLESPIPFLEIGKAIAFLQSCHGSQVSGNMLNNGQRSNNVVLSLSEVNEIIEAMRKYIRLGDGVIYDFSHNLGFREYLVNENKLVSSAQGNDPLAHEAEEPVQHPIGRPKKRGKQFPNKPLRNKADLLKMVLPSKLQQMESVEDEAGKEAGGKAANKGKGKML